jgi:sugar phosphate isomerase/epimerase
MLAVKPMHAAAASGCSFLTRLVDALELVEDAADPAIRLAVDLWQFGDDPELLRLLPRLAAVTALVQVADREGPPTAELERLPVGRGSLPLESLVLALIDHGYGDHGFGGDFELDPVGETVVALGYDRVLEEARRVADAWTMAVEERLLWSRATAAVWQANRLQFRSAGSRRSQASSQTVSRG